MARRDHFRYGWARHFSLPLGFALLLTLLAACSTAQIEAPKQREQLAEPEQDPAREARVSEVADPDSLATGLASWYGRGHQGKRTASGERFDRHALTAAHRTLPLGSCLAVFSPATQKSVTVRVNDRGPAIRGRIIDLSEAAAEAIGLRRQGVGLVLLRPCEDTPILAAR